MKEIPTTPPLLDALHVHDFILGLVNQVVPCTGSWCSRATPVSYPVRIAPIVYMAFQAQPASSVRVQLDPSMGCDTVSTQFSAPFISRIKPFPVHPSDRSVKKILPKKITITI
ncbi:hypothetical protein DSO57_1033436 [Entomophthora muscae]|uniref:Uncharacterized protein n=1 Tax=Entomophthora muscae TaxID=34485 RepID=A0ACC2UKV3_9FUNG|nr:hypothetical protein DSO57_1033436 [Entomophthora muscae]